MLANFAVAAFHHVPRVATWIVQEGGAVGWDPISLWKQMGIIAKIVVIILFIMSGWSIGVMIDRAMAYNAARKQSRAFAPAVAGALRDGRIDEAIKVAERNKKSHLAKVVTAGLMEFKAHQDSPGAIPGETIEASKRALERTEAIVHAELKRGLGGSGHHRIDSSLRGTVRHRDGHSERLQRYFRAEGYRSGRGRRRHFGSAGDHGFRFAGGNSRRHDVQLPHRPRRSVRCGDGQFVERTDRLLPEAARRSPFLGPVGRAGLRLSCFVRRRIDFRRRASLSRECRGSNGDSHYVNGKTK